MTDFNVKIKFESEKFSITENIRVHNPNDIDTILQSSEIINSLINEHHENLVEYKLLITTIGSSPSLIYEAHATLG